MKPLALLALLLLSGLSLADDGVIDIGSRRELFIDRALIEHMQDATLEVNRPINRGPVFKFDMPWEGAFCGYVTVIHDNDKYRLYYRGLPDVGDREVTCYAESNDGIRWTRPELGLHEIDGSIANNVILVSDPVTEAEGVKESITHNFSPMLDANPSAEPAHKYKALAGNGHTLYALSSPDGIHWRKLRDDPVMTYEDPGKPDPASNKPSLGPFAFDSQNVSFWSESENKYVVYARLWVFTLDENGKRTRQTRFRTIGRAESEDFINWTPLRPMTYSDTGTVMPSCHLYTNQTQAYFRAPHIYISTAARFMPGREVLSEDQAHAIGVHPKYFKDASDNVLMTSRGGYHYDREFTGSFIRPGIGAANWVSRSNYPVLNVVQTSDEEMSLYIQRNYAQPTAHLNRYTLRFDGFASIRADLNGGGVTTKPLRFKGDRLYVNFATSAAGSVRIELQDELGAAIPGYSLADCRELIGDEIERVVHWVDGPDVSALAGSVVRLHLELKDADVYAIRFGAP